MLRIHHLHKSYTTGVRALTDVSLDIPPGVFGLLGPNGAGKSTFMKIAATLLEPDSGIVMLGELDVLRRPRSARRILGYLPQDFGFYPSFTAEQMLNYFAKLKGLTNRRERRATCNDLLERVNLARDRARLLGEFSGGMRQRLGIAQALLGRPRLLIVDEPTAGLDPEERNRFHNILVESAQLDTVVVLSTHIVADIANLCQRIAILVKGEVIASSTPREALATIDGSMWEGIVPRDQAAVLHERIQIVSQQLFQGQMRMRAHSPGVRPPEGFAQSPATLEDYYLLQMARHGSRS